MFLIVIRAVIGGVMLVIWRLTTFTQSDIDHIPSSACAPSRDGVSQLHVASCCTQVPEHTYIGPSRPHQTNTYVSHYIPAILLYRRWS